MLSKSYHGDEIDDIIQLNIQQEHNILYCDLS
jgi:hypothetical protein